MLAKWTLQGTIILGCHPKLYSSPAWCFKRDPQPILLMIIFRESYFLCLIRSGESRGKKGFAIDSPSFGAFILRFHCEVYVEVRNLFASGVGFISSWAPLRNWNINDILIDFRWKSFSLEHSAKHKDPAMMIHDLFTMKKKMNFKTRLSRSGAHSALRKNKNEWKTVSVNHTFLQEVKLPSRLPAHKFSRVAGFCAAKSSRLELLIKKKWQTLSWCAQKPW